MRTDGDQVPVRVLFMLFLTRLFGVTGSEPERNLGAEQAYAQEIVERILLMQANAAAKQHRPLGRGTHAKGVTARAQFEVFDVTVGRDPAVAARLARGIFATPGIYPATVRFANSDPQVNSDFKADVRSLSLPGARHVARRRLAVVVASVIAHQHTRHAEDHVVVDMRIVGDKNLGDQRLIARLIAHHVQVRRPIGFATLRPQEVADWAVGGDGIACGLDRAELKDAVLAGAQPSAEVHLGLVRILVLVEADRRGMPDIDLHLWHRPALRVAEMPGNKQRRAGCRRPDDAGAVGCERRIVLKIRSVDRETRCR